MAAFVKKSRSASELSITASVKLLKACGGMASGFVVSVLVTTTARRAKGQYSLANFAHRTALSRDSIAASLGRVTRQAGTECLASSCARNMESCVFGSSTTALFVSGTRVSNAMFLSRTA